MASLRELGLSEYEVRVYRAILRAGPTTAKELSSTSGVPMGRIYDVLGGLESVGMVRSQRAGRPQRYAAVEPRTALDRLLAERRRELDAELRGYETAVDELRERLEATAPADEPFWTVAVGPAETVDLLIERFSAATERIVTVASKPSGQLDLAAVGDRIAGGIESALDRGVVVSVLVTPSLVDAVPPGVLDRFEGLLAGRDNLEVRVADVDATGTFNLIDHTEVCIEVPNPLAPDEAFALIALTDPTFAANVYAEFRPRWEQATPYQVQPA